MKEHPILFQGEMVRAILEGRKTQTRRTSKLDVINKNPDDWEYIDCLSVSKLHRFKYKTPAEHEYIKCPYGVPGDRLWVREQCCEEMIGSASLTRYKADGYATDIPWWYSRKSCPSIHMPRRASRILLEITDIRVERVQDITFGDCEREGIESQGMPMVNGADRKFKELWNPINEKKGFGWDVNPWVWVVEFKVIK